MGASGANKVEGADSLEACLAACASADNCLAAEYSDAYKCWIHSDKTYDARLKENDGVTLYILGECAGACHILSVLRVT